MWKMGIVVQAVRRDARRDAQWGVQWGAHPVALLVAVIDFL